MGIKYDKIVSEGEQLRAVVMIHGWQGNKDSFKSIFFSRQYGQFHNAPNHMNSICIELPHLRSSKAEALSLFIANY